MQSQNIVEIEIIKAVRVTTRTAFFRPLMSAPVRAGFPSPADDFVDQGIDWNQQLIANPMATFYVRVAGDSMVGAGIREGDTLVVDRSAKPSDGHIIVARLEDTFTVKRLRLVGRKVFLVPENEAFDVIEIGPESDFEVWGVVTWVVHRV